MPALRVFLLFIFEEGNPAVPEKRAYATPINGKPAARGGYRDSGSVDDVFRHDADSVAVTLEVKRKGQDPGVGIFAGLVHVHHVWGN